MMHLGVMRILETIKYLSEIINFFIKTGFILITEIK
jgi:hypothetical protein